MLISKNYITKLGGFKPELPHLIEMMVKSIPGDVPKNLALSIAISEASAFVTSWRNSILLNTPGTKLKTLVPTNSYIFSLSPSG